MSAKFIPIRTTEDRLPSFNRVNGYVYFTVDTGKIYLDTATERISVGGNGVAVLYGDFPKTEADEAGLFTFDSENLAEETPKPHVNDLVLNSDGAFYKILEVNGTQLICKQLAVAGGGGGGSVATGSRTSLRIIDPPNKSLINGQEIVVEFVAAAEKDSEGNYTDDDVDITWVLEESVGSNLYQQYLTGTINDVVNGSTGQLKLTDKLRPSTTSRLTMIAHSANGNINDGNSYSRSVTFTTSELTLAMSTDFSNTKLFETTNAPIVYNISGNMSKIVDIYVGKGGAQPQLIHDYELGPGTALNETFPLDDYVNLEHDYYTIIIKVSQSIDGKRGLSIEPLQFEIAVRGDSNKPIIWLGSYQKEYYNYDDIRIPFLVYDPDHTDLTSVHLYKNGVEMAGYPRDEKGSAHTKFSTFEIVNAELGIRNYYSISCGENDRRTERQIDFLLSQDPNRDMSLVKQTNLKLLFDAKGRTNSESAVNRSSWSYKDIKATFDNFNWYNNGWAQDAQGNTCLRISNGARFILPVGTMKLAGGSVSEQSVAFEMQFKVRNVQDYTPLIHNVTRYKGDDTYYTAFRAQTAYSNYDSFLAYWLPTQTDASGNPLSYDALEFDYVQKDIDTTKAIATYIPDDGSSFGMAVGSQDAFFSNGTNTVNVSFVEDEMVYLSAVYTHSSKLLTIFINGVMTGVIESTLDGEFDIGNDNFIFNSEFCDIDLYKMRIYNTNLTINELITNYAVDKKDVVIFDQNNTKNGFVIDNSSIGELQLQFSGVEKYNIDNPDKYTMPYIVFDTSMNGDQAKKLPWSKKTKIYATVSFVNPALDRAYINGELEELAIKDGLCTAMDSAEDRAAAVERYYVHHCPSWTGDGVEMVVQGTSSEFYPRRNYKLKTKDKNDNVNIFFNKGPFAERFLTCDKKDYDHPCHSDWFYLDNYEVGTTKWTMKIDYMESSGSYNTGFANLVHNAYSKHPLADYDRFNRFKNADGTKYELSESYLNSLRTSVQGYPVMAFHKRGENDYVYIGRYNMNLDKGSDECYGFKPDKTMYAYDMNGELVRVRDLAECWEFQNNARGFCSFRDPWNREVLSFDGTGQENAYTSFQSPIVADHVEYRYSPYDDALDGLWELKDNTSPEKKMVIWTNLGWAKEVEEIKSEWVENVDYAIIDGKIYEYEEPDLIRQYDFTDDNLEPGRKLFLKLLENWERANIWVWSTNTDNAISGFEYAPIALGKQMYAPGTFYLLQEDGSYEKEASSSTFDPELTYYEESIVTEGDEEVTVMVNAWVVNDASLIYEKEKFYSCTNPEETNEEKREYVLQVSDTFDASIDYYQSTPLTPSQMDTKISLGVAKHTKKLAAPVTFEGITYEYDTKEYRLAKFRNELSKHFNVEYLATYFVMTEVFECYDSRGKNSMWASWGPQIDGGDYIWYPIFYDIDTQLGINNTGIPSFEYNVDATEDGNYSTSDSLVWNNFYKCFKNTYILDKYRQLRGETVSSFDEIKTPILNSVDKIEKWYQCDPVECNSLVMRGIRPLIAINLDEYYKYLTIYNPAGTNKNDGLYGLTGRINDSGDFVVETTSYHYALQGDRSLSRRQFLANRIEYIDSWLNVGNYARGGYNRLWGRISARRPQSGGTFLNSDRWYEDSTNLAETSYYLDNATEAEKRYDFDAEYWATLTPVRNSYVTIQDDSAVYPSQKFSGIPLKVKFNALENGIRTSQDYNEQLCYIYGINQMKDLGDLYKMYWQEFKIEGDAGKLTKLLLGCDGLMTKRNANGSYSVVLDENGDTAYGDDPTKKAYKWFNNKMNLPSMPSGTNSTGMPLLKEANFSNVTISTTSPVLDLTSCEKLEDFRATGSNFAQVKFAPGVALNTLYLPKTITTLELSEAKLLNSIVEEYNYPVRQDDGSYKMETPGLYIEGLTDDTMATTQLNALSITGDAMGYDSYRLLTKYWNRVDKTTGKKITMTGVNWCPYIQLVEGDTYDEENSALYYRDNGHYGLSPYRWININVFNADVLNGEVYKYNPDLAEDAAIITSDSMIKLLKSAHNTKLEGTMFIQNATKVDELEVSNLNSKEKYPNLKLFYGGEVEKAYSAKFVLPLECVDKDTNTWTYDYVPVENSDELSVQKVAATDYTDTQNIFADPFAIYLPEKVHHDFLGWSIYPEGVNAMGQTDVISDSAAWRNTIVPEGVYDHTFYAIFKITQYPITFYQGDNAPITVNMDYGSFVRTPTAQPWIPDPDDIALTETCAFRGYTSTEPESETEKYHLSADDSLVQDLPNEKVTGPRTYYPVFVPMSVYDNIHEEYFIMADGVISWNPEYTVRGKLTIPYVIGGVPVTGIQSYGFSGYTYNGLQGVTHIFWSDKNGASSNKFVSLGIGEVLGGGNSFTDLTNMVYFEMPVNIKIIPQYCFNGCSMLYSGGFSDSMSTEYYVDKAFAKIENIGTLAFTFVPIKDLKLSDATVTLGNRCFKNLGGLESLTLGKNLSLSTCGTELFAGNNGVQVYMPTAYNTSDWTSKFLFEGDCTINLV